MLKVVIVCTFMFLQRIINVSKVTRFEKGWHVIKKFQRRNGNIISGCPHSDEQYWRRNATDRSVRHAQPHVRLGGRPHHAGYSRHHRWYKNMALVFEKLILQSTFFFFKNVLYFWIQMHLILENKNITIESYNFSKENLSVTKSKFH